MATAKPMKNLIVIFSPARNILAKRAAKIGAIATIMPTFDAVE